VKRSNRTLALCFAALGVLFRPTNAIIWLYPGVVHFLQTRDRAHLVFGVVLPIALATTLAMLCIDRLGYGEWAFVPLNFFKFNVLEVSIDEVQDDPAYRTRTLTARTSCFFLSGQGQAVRRAPVELVFLAGLSSHCGHYAAGRDCWLSHCAGK
jgi:hypothetical protein